MAEPLSLLPFIRDAKSSGVADEFIVALLKNAGWSERRIYAAFTDYYEKALDARVPSRGNRIEYARDAFFYLLTFITLGIWTIALGQIFYQLIDRWFPDTLDLAFVAAYSIRNISWQIAAVVVAFPVFLFVSQLQAREVSNRPELLDSGVRKWLTNLALVVAAVVVVGDLVTFIATFLSGDLTARFIGKVLVVLLLAGGVFGYYLSTLRDVRSPGLQRSFFAASLLGVAAAVVLGFVATGTPSHQRDSRVDEQRVGSLRAMAEALSASYNRHPSPGFTMPKTFDDVRSLTPFFGDVSPVDPVDGKPYEYRMLGGTRYELCGRFTTDTRAVPPANDRWKHPAGRWCFQRDAATGVARGSPGWMQSPSVIAWVLPLSPPIAGHNRYDPERPAVWRRAPISIASRVGAAAAAAAVVRPAPSALERCRPSPHRSHVLDVQVAAHRFRVTA